MLWTEDASQWEQAKRPGPWLKTILFPSARTRVVPGTHPGPAPRKIRDPHRPSGKRLRKTDPQVSPPNTWKQGEECLQRQTPKRTLSHKSAYKACPARYRPRPADIEAICRTLRPFRSCASSGQGTCRYPPGYRNCLCHGYGLRAGAQGPPGHLGLAGDCDRPGALPCTAKPSMA